MRRLGDIGRIGSGSGFPVRYQGQRQGEYPFFKVSDMNHVGNDIFLTVSKNRIGDRTRRLLGATGFPAGSIVFAKVGAAIFLERKRILGQPSCLDNNMAAFVLADLSVDRRFAFHMLSSIRLSALASATALPSLGGGVLANICIPLPVLPEQRAIAAVLMDVDALIGSLEALIAKKRAIKRAAMQQLLTGRTRLPGFEGEWETRRLGDLARIATGTRNNQDKRHDGRYPFFVRSSSVERIDSFAYDCEAILIPGEGRIGEIFHYVHGRFDVHQRVYAISDFRSSVFVRFLYYYIAEHFGAHALKNTVKATVDSLRRPTFLAFRVPLPPVPEQRAIAAVLTDMDAEIAALERRLDKTRSIKQGMMQQLLTGVIRLPIPDDELEGESHDA